MNLKSLLSRLTTLEKEIAPHEDKKFSFIFDMLDGTAECNGKEYPDIEAAEKDNPGEHWYFKIVEAAPE